MTLSRRSRVLEGVLVVGAPLALALLEVFHPHPPHDLFQLDVRTWLWVHYLQIPLFPLAALAVVVLVRDASGFAAGLCRVSIFAFAVIFTVFDTAAGIVTGTLLQAAHRTDTPEAWREPVMAIWEHPILGGSRNITPVLAVVGSLAWLVGTVAAAVAVRRAGSSWVPVVLLVVLNDVFVACWIIVISAAGMTAPLESVTVPVISPRSPCAGSRDGNKAARRTRWAIRMSLVSLHPCGAGC